MSFFWIVLKKVMEMKTKPSLISIKKPKMIFLAKEFNIVQLWLEMRKKRQDLGLNPFWITYNLIKNHVYQKRKKFHLWISYKKWNKIKKQKKKKFWKLNKICKNIKNWKNKKLWTNLSFLILETTSWINFYYKPKMKNATSLKNHNWTRLNFPQTKP